MTTQHRVWNTLKKHGPITPKELAYAAGVEYDHVRSILRRLAVHRYVEKQGRKVVALMEPPADRRGIELNKRVRKVKPVEVFVPNADFLLGQCWAMASPAETSPEIIP